MREFCEFASNDSLWVNYYRTLQVEYSLALQSGIASQTLKIAVIGQNWSLRRGEGNLAVMLQNLRNWLLKSDGDRTGGRCSMSRDSWD